MSQAGPTNTEQNPSVPTLFVCNTGTAVPLANTLDVLGSGSISTTGAGNVITITTTAGVTWNVVTSANNPVTLTKSNGYIAKGASAVDFVLPASAAIGDTFQIIGYANLWTIAQNANQSITIGKVTSTVGVGGSVTATSVSDGITLVCVTTNNEFYEVAMQGNPSIV